MELDSPVEDQNHFVYEDSAVKAYIRSKRSANVTCPVAGILSFSALSFLTLYLLQVSCCRFPGWHCSSGAQMILQSKSGGAG